MIPPVSHAPRTAANLTALALRYAAERAAPAGTIIKEILHYEVLYALVESGAARNLVFQGGTCLRLCHQGTRYSEDLDFAGGADFTPASVDPFLNLLQERILGAYGLTLDMKAKRSPGEAVSVDRFTIRIQVPQPDPSLPQKQVINVEIASVPSRDPDLLSVGANYDHLPGPLRSMVIVGESKEEILADKVVALAGRPFIKHRDLWDLKFLADQNVQLRPDLVSAKLGDYGIARHAFLSRLEERLLSLQGADVKAAFRGEMSRFVDSKISAALESDAMVQRFLSAAERYGQAAIGALNASSPSSRSRPRP